MLWEEWLGNNAFDLISSAGAVFGLLFTAHSIRQETESRKVGNALSLTQNHRELWSLIIKDTELHRVLDPNADVEKTPPTLEEQLFVRMLILHIRTALKARETALDFADEDLAADVQHTFELPVIRAVWLKTKAIQGADLADLIEGRKAASTNSAFTAEK